MSRWRGTWKEQNPMLNASHRARAAAYRAEVLARIAAATDEARRRRPAPPVTREP